MLKVKLLKLVIKFGFKIFNTINVFRMFPTVLRYAKLDMSVCVQYSVVVLL